MLQITNKARLSDSLHPLASLVRAEEARVARVSAPAGWS
jgi:hypothetical protein